MALYDDEQDYRFAQDDENDQPRSRTQSTQSVDYSGWQTPANNPNQPATPAPVPATLASNPFNYEQARDSWMSGQYGQGEEGARAWAAANGVQYNGGDVINLPNGGGLIDIIGNFRNPSAGLRNNWTAAGNNGPNPNGVAAGAGSGSVSSAGSGGGSASRSPYYDTLIRNLFSRAGQGLNVDAATDPNIRAQADPYRANVERASRNYVADQAERLGPGANITGEERVAAEHAGQAAGMFESRLVGHEIDARREEIQQALAELGGILSADEERSLRQELAYLNDETQRLGINTNAGIAMRGQDLQNNQFMNRLGLDTEQQANYWDALRSGQLG